MSRPTRQERRRRRERRKAYDELSRLGEAMLCARDERTYEPLGFVSFDAFLQVRFPAMCPHKWALTDEQAMELAADAIRLAETRRAKRGVPCH